MVIPHITLFRQTKKKHQMLCFGITETLTSIAYGHIPGLNFVFHRKEINQDPNSISSVRNYS